MAATTGATGSGRRNYYNVSYGKISSRVKEAPENFTEIAEADLKSKIQNVEQVDLRKKFVDKGTGEYPIRAFFDSLTGVIIGQEKHENEQGTNLNLSVLDTDGETSILQVKFYSKYAENLLNRLLNIEDTTKEMTFTPYQIPSEFDIDGKTIKAYNQGVSIKMGGEKIEVAYKNDNKDLPKTEQVKVSGKTTTSRDKRLDFLYGQFEKHFVPAPSDSIVEKESIPVTSTKPTSTQQSKAILVDDDLPF